MQLYLVLIPDSYIMNHTAISFIVTVIPDRCVYHTDTMVVLLTNETAIFCPDSPCTEMGTTYSR